MSGTSLDGIDAALITTDGREHQLQHAVFRPFDPKLRQELLALNQSTENELTRAAVVSNVLAEGYSLAVTDLLAQARTDPSAVSAIGCHGQTVRHRPDLGFTLQIGNPALLAERTGIAVVADFRSRDIAAGGQGAPLVPAFHAAAFRHPERNRVIVNIGGISNITWLPARGHTSGFDCGPGNLLLDGWAQLHLGKEFDQDGHWAATGHSRPDILGVLLSHSFFAAPPPKSTGRDMFNLDWLKALLPQDCKPADVQATLLEFSARIIVDAVRRHCPGADGLYLCGGGARNGALRRRIAQMLPELPVGLSDDLGIGSDWVEAAAFAWLAHQTLHGLPGNLPEVTGADGLRVLGAIYPA